jgi:N-acetylneuraminic acid mutarotase
MRKQNRRQLTRWALVSCLLCGATCTVMLRGNQQETGRWKRIPRAPLVSPRAVIGSVLTGNKLIVWGGEKSDKPASDGAVYDLDRGAWSKMAPAPLEGHEHFTMLALGEDRVIVWGGESDPRGAIYDAVKNSWKRVADAPITLGMEPYTSGILQDKLLVWGIGVTSRQNAVGAVYDIDKNVWTKMPDAPMLALDDWPAFFYKRKFVVWGGRSAGTDGVHGALYDVDTNTWKTIARAPLEIGLNLDPNGKGRKEGRNWGATTLVGNKLVIWSGCPGPVVAQPRGSFADGAVYDIDTDTWKTMSKAPIEPRFFPRACAWGNKVVVWGGIRDRFFFDGAIYDIEHDSWETIPDAPVRARWDIYSYGLFGYNRAAPALRGSRLVIWGGQEDATSGAKDASVGAIFDLEKRTWERIPPGPIRGRDYHALFLSGNRLVIWGGRDASTVSLDGAIYEMGRGSERR